MILAARSFSLWHMFKVFVGVSCGFRSLCVRALHVVLLLLDVVHAVPSHPC